MVPEVEVLDHVNDVVLVVVVLRSQRVKSHTGHKGVNEKISRTMCVSLCVCQKKVCVARQQTEEFIPRRGPANKKWCQMYTATTYLAWQPYRDYKLFTATLVAL